MDSQNPGAQWLVVGAAVAALGVSIAAVVLAATPQPGDPLAGSGMASLGWLAQLHANHVSPANMARASS